MRYKAAFAGRRLGRWQCHAGAAGRPRLGSRAAHHGHWARTAGGGDAAQVDTVAVFAATEEETEDFLNEVHWSSFFK